MTQICELISPLCALWVTLDKKWQIKDSTAIRKSRKKTDKVERERERVSVCHMRCPLHGTTSWAIKFPVYLMHVNVRQAYFKCLPGCMAVCSSPGHSLLSFCLTKTDEQCCNRQWHHTIIRHPHNTPPNQKQHFKYFKYLWRAAVLGLGLTEAQSRSCDDIKRAPVAQRK